MKAKPPAAAAITGGERALPCHADAPPHGGMKTALLRALALACVLAPLAGCDIDNRTITGWYEGIKPPDAPVAEPPGGLYDEGQDVTLTCADELAEIYWAIDGNPTDPAQGIKYDGTSIHVELGQTLRAYATKGQGYDSGVTTAVYSGFPPDAPVAEPPGGIYEEAQEVTLTCTDELAVIYYLIVDDPTQPVNKGDFTEYQGGTIHVEPGKTLRAYATNTSGYDSSMMREIYSELSFGKLGTPYVNLYGGVAVTNPEAELYAVSQLGSGIELVSPSDGADIYYTITYSTTYGTTPAAPLNPTTADTKYAGPISVAWMDGEAGGTVTAVKIKAIAHRSLYTDSDVMPTKTLEIVQSVNKFIFMNMYAHSQRASMDWVSMPLAVVATGADGMDTLYGFLETNPSGSGSIYDANGRAITYGQYEASMNIPGVTTFSMRICAAGSSQMRLMHFLVETSKIRIRTWKTPTDLYKPFDASKGSGFNSAYENAAGAYTFHADSFPSTGDAKTTCDEIWGTGSGMYPVIKFPHVFVELR
ncbi:MAG: chitobiase/beta-hexosaminidase C-terminal domain-containing protein [Treponematales bacterium]